MELMNLGYSEGTGPQPSFIEFSKALSTLAARNIRMDYQRDHHESGISCLIVQASSHFIPLVSIAITLRIFRS